MSRRNARPRGEEWLRRALVAWVDGARRHAGWIALGAALFTLACGVIAARGLGVETDTEAVFDPDLPFARSEARLDAAFPMLEDSLVVVLDADEAQRAADAAETLAARLRAEPELYPDVFAPGVGPFFERQGLLYRDLDDLEDLADQLAAAQPFLAEASRDPSLRGLFRMFGRALDEATSAAARGLDLEGALASVESAAREAARRQIQPLAFDELMIRPRERGPERRYVLVQPRIDYADPVPGQPALDRLRATLGELTAGGELRARVTGNPALIAEELAITQRQSAVAGAASFVMVTLILSLALRSARLVLATMATLAAGLVWTAAFAALAVGRLNLVSMAFAVLFIGLAVDFGIHLGLRYRELRGQGEESGAALRETAGGVGSSLVLCALTTSTGFFAFVPTAYWGVGQLGMIAGTGMFIGLFASLTLLPALIALGGGERRPPAPVPAPAGALRLSSRAPRAVAIGAALLALVCAVLAPRLRFDANYLRVRDPGAESVRTFQELVAEGDVNPWSAEIVEPSLDSAVELSRRLRELPEVDRSVTLADYVPDDQQAKLAILADARLLLHLAPEGERRPPPTPEEERAALAAFRDALRRFLAGEPAPRLRELATRVEGAVADLLARVPEDGGRGPLAELEASLVPPIADGILALGRALAPAPVELASLPADLRRRLLAPDGRARVQVFPVEDLNDGEALEGFVEAVRVLAPDVTGDAVYMLESGRTITRALRQAFAGATAMIALLLLLLWRSPRDMALVLAPIGLAALVLTGISVLLDVPLNFANVIVLPLLLGIGVDSGIHMVHRFRSGEADLLGSSTPRAVWWAALTTIASFGSLAFASHRGMASLGQLLALGVALTVVANLVVLPALLALLRRPGVADPPGLGDPGLAEKTRSMSLQTPRD